jgi:predicted acetyltransferase
MDVLVRKATEDDLERVLEIHASSFPDHRGHDVRRRQFDGNPLGGMSDLYVVERGGRLVGHALLHPLSAWFGGREVQLGGIESVGIAPEARGLGIGAHLLERLHADSRARGDALTLLYVFRQGFYARLGYAPITPMMQLEVRPASIPKAWIDAARGTLRPITGDDRARVESLYAEAAVTRTGWIRRPATYWEARLLEDRSAWFITDDRRGYVSWTLSQSELHAPIKLIVGDLVAAAPAVERQLWGHLGAQKDQVHTIEIDVTVDDPMMLAFTDADAHRVKGTARLEHPWGTVHSNGMIRLHDTHKALEARGYASDGQLTLALGSDESWHLEVSGGGARVSKASRPCDLLFPDSASLAMVAFGGLRPSQAARAGLVESRDPRALRLADELFSLPSFHAREPF